MQAMSTLVHEETLWSTQVFRVPAHDPVQIRLSIHAGAVDAQIPAAHYLVVTGFFKILHDLSVSHFRYEFGSEGLVFYVDVRESRNVVRGHLQNMKTFHVLGKAWDLVLVDGARVSVIASEGHVPKLSSVELEMMAWMHAQMGSRPLRFSRYFLYAALLPFARVRGYGSVLMGHEDSTGRVNFYHVLEGLELLQRSLQSIDVSGIRSREELHQVIKPLEHALDEIGRRDGFLRGMLIQVLVLAVVYEQKTTDAQLKAKAQALSEGFNREAVGSGMMAMLGFEPLLDLLDVDPHLLQDTDDLSLYLLSRFRDPALSRVISLKQIDLLQELARVALEKGSVDREQLNQFFYQNQLVADGVRDWITILQLLSMIRQEE